MSILAETKFTMSRKCNWYSIREIYLDKTSSRGLKRIAYGSDCIVVADCINYKIDTNPNPVFVCLVFLDKYVRSS